MSIYDGFRRERGVRFRPLNEEDETARHKRGWDPRKTYAENMGHESLFDRPEDDFGWAEPTQQRRTTRPKPTRQVRELAAEGRGEDTEIAHVARGEYVIPRAMQTPELMAAFRRAAAAYGVPVERLNVGNVRNRINPNTGAPEFGGMDDEDSAQSSTGEQPPITYQPGVASPSPAINNMITCMRDSLGRPIIVSSTSEAAGPHMDPDTPHGRGEAADIKIEGDPDAIMQAGKNCGAAMWIDEYRTPTDKATGGHYHFQTTPGRGGYYGQWIPPKWRK